MWLTLMWKVQRSFVYFSHHQPHCHSSIKAIFKPHKSLLYSPHTPLTPHHFYLSPPLSNCLHTVQGAHGLDGKPGPVVSGPRLVPLTPSPLISLHLPLSFGFYSLPAAGYVSEYICLSACLTFSACFCLSYFPCCVRSLFRVLVRLDWHGDGFWDCIAHKPVCL